MRLSILVPVVSLSFLVSLAGCRTERRAACGNSRILVDTLGEGDERARIAMQWAKVQGTFDSVAGTREGKLAQDRAAGATERNLARYRDSLVRDDGVLTSLDGCVDWPRSWAEERFDRLAMAGALVRGLVGESAGVVIGFRFDSTTEGTILEVESLPDSSGPASGESTFHFRFDSTEVRLLPSR